MKINLIFRGENERDYIKYVNALNNVDNWKEMIINPLLELDHCVDITFITYSSKTLNELVNIINPKNVILCEYEKSNQVTNFYIVNEYIKKHKDDYDRFIILRFDILYKQPIYRWNNWNKTGIIIPNKDSTWDDTHYYNDIIFIIDSSSIIQFSLAVEYMNNLLSVPVHLRPTKHNPMPHHIGKYLYENKIEFYEMYPNKFDGLNHPLYIFSRCLS